MEWGAAFEMQRPLLYSVLMDQIPQLRALGHVALDLELACLEELVIVEFAFRHPHEMLVTGGDVCVRAFIRIRLNAEMELLSLAVQLNVELADRAAGNSELERAVVLLREKIPVYIPVIGDDLLVDLFERPESFRERDDLLLVALKDAAVQPLLLLRAPRP